MKDYDVVVVGAGPGGSYAAKTAAELGLKTVFFERGSAPGVKNSSGCGLGTRWWRDFPGSADELLTRFASRHRGEITLIALGPLTNLALAWQRNPEVMKEWREVVIMGGAVRTGGNVTPHAEFNFYVDPQAARIVLESGMPVTLVPLDATHQVSLTPGWMEERVLPPRNPLSRFLIESTGYDPAVGRFRGGRKEFFLHDPLAVGAVINPALVKKEDLYLEVVADGGEYDGQSREVSPGGPKAEVCLGVDRAGFLDLFLSRLEG